MDLWQYLGGYCLFWLQSTKMTIFKIFKLENIYYIYWKPSSLTLDIMLIWSIINIEWNWSDIELMGMKNICGKSPSLTINLLQENDLNNWIKNENVIILMDHVDAEGSRRCDGIKSMAMNLIDIIDQKINNYYLCIIKELD